MLGVGVSAGLAGSVAAGPWMGRPCWGELRLMVYGYQDVGLGERGFPLPIELPQAPEGTKAGPPGISHEPSSGEPPRGPLRQRKRRGFKVPAPTEDNPGESNSEEGNNRIHKT